MRFHKSETAFFVFVALILVSGVLTVYAYHSLGDYSFDYGPHAHTLTVVRLLFGSAVLTATALTFGMFFIYPLIRTQVREEGKLRAMTETLSARSQTLEHAALTDSLTGMQNRRYFDDALREYLQEFKRINKPVGLVILDLDHFKTVNDTHGHDVGDEVLKVVANCLRDFTRHHDVAARLGGGPTRNYGSLPRGLDIDTLIRRANPLES